MFNFTNYAYGIDYQTKASYSYDSLRKLSANKNNYNRILYPHNPNIGKLEEEKYGSHG